MQQLVGQSPWDWIPVWERLAKRMTAELEPDSAWVVDDTGFPKQAEHSVPSKASRANKDRRKSHYPWTGDGAHHLALQSENNQRVWPLRKLAWSRRQSG